MEVRVQGGNEHNGWNQVPVCHKSAEAEMATWVHHHRQQSGNPVSPSKYRCSITMALPSTCIVYNSFLALHNVAYNHNNPSIPSYSGTNAVDHKYPCLSRSLITQTNSAEPAPVNATTLASIIESVRTEPAWVNSCHACVAGRLCQ